MHEHVNINIRVSWHIHQCEQSHATHLIVCMSVCVYQLKETFLEMLMIIICTWRECESQQRYCLKRIRLHRCVIASTQLSRQLCRQLNAHSYKKYIQIQLMFIRLQMSHDLIGIQLVCGQF